MNLRIILVFLSLGILMGGAPKKEPVYQGKTPSEWIKSPDLSIKLIRSFEEDGIDVVPPLVEALQDKDLKVREAALKNLEKVEKNTGHSTDLILPLLVAWKDPDRKIREQANRLLEEFPKQWGDLTHSGFDWYDSISPEALKKLGPTALPILTNGLKHPNEFVRGMAMALLGSLGPRSKEVVPTMEKILLGEKPTRLRGEAAAALCQIDTAGPPSLKKALTSPEKPIRRGAVYGLSRFPPKKPDDFPVLLLEVLKDSGKEDGLSQLVVSALKKLKVPTKPTDPLLLDSDPFVQIWFAYHLDQEKTVPGLVQAMDNSDGRIRRKAVEILRQEKEAEGLVQGLKNKDPEVRQLVVQALNELGPAAKPFLPVLAECLGDDDLVVSERARQILVKFGADAVPFFMKALKEGRPQIRRSSVFALGQIGPPAKEALPLLVEMLKNDTQEDLAWEVRRTLKKIQPQEK